MELSQSEFVDGVDLSLFKSPLRILARHFLRSRDQWKQKCLQAKQEIKRFKNKAADAVKSRDQWRRKFEQLQIQAQSLESELEQLRAESQTAAGVKKSQPRRTAAAAS